MSFYNNNLGNLAYYDTFTGLIPCKVTGYDGYNTIYFTVTANRGAYKTGERLSSTPSHVIPRKMVHTRGGQFYIWNYYAWVNGISEVYAIQTRGEH